MRTSDAERQQGRATSCATRAARAACRRTSSRSAWKRCPRQHGGRHRRARARPARRRRSDPAAGTAVAAAPDGGAGAGPPAALGSRPRCRSGRDAGRARRHGGLAVAALPPLIAVVMGALLVSMLIVVGVFAVALAPVGLALFAIAWVVQRVFRGAGHPPPWAGSARACGAAGIRSLDDARRSGEVPCGRSSIGPGRSLASTLRTARRRPRRRGSGRARRRSAGRRRHRTGAGLCPQPGRRPRHPDPDRPEGRRLLQRRPGPASRLPPRDADRPDVARRAQRHVRRRQERDGGRRREHGVGLHLHARPGPVRAGDGLLLDHPGTAVHPEPGLRRRAAGRQPPSGGRAHQPVRRGQLVLPRHQDRHHAREGRRRRRRGRGGDRARVRALGAGRPGARVRHVGGRGRDRRGLRRLPGRRPSRPRSPRRRTSRVSPTGTPRPTP